MSYEKITPCSSTVFPGSCRAAFADLSVSFISSLVMELDEWLGFLKNSDLGKQVWRRKGGKDGFLVIVDPLG